MKTKLVLVALNTKYIHSNLAVYDIEAYTLNKWNCSAVSDNQIIILVREFTINHNTDHIMQELYREKADVYAFSCYIWNISEVLSITKKLNKVLPYSYIWLGGPEVSYDSKKVLVCNEYIKGIIVGEGEETFHELTYIWNDKNNEYDSYRNVKGITYRDNYGNIINTGKRELMEADDIPFIYTNENIRDRFNNKILYYETSRGCPFSCSYCLSSINKSVRFRSIELVQKELDFFLKNKVKQVKFIDRTFNCSRSHSLAIWRYIAGHDNGITNFHFEIAADLIGEEEFEVFGRMRPGLIQLEIGLQSTNSDTITEIRRSMDVDKVKNVLLRLASMNNIHTHLDLIAGLPYEDYDSFVHSFNDACSMLPDQLQLGFLKVLKGSYMEEKKEEYGLIYSDTEPYEIMQTKWITYDDILQLKIVEEMVEAYHNSRQYINTLNYILLYYNTPYEFYESIGRYYYEHSLSFVGFRRESRYEAIRCYIMDYMKQAGKCQSSNGNSSQHAEFSMETFDSLLTYDYYLRENAKNRPSWSPEQIISKKAYNDFFRNAGNEYVRICTPDYNSRYAARAMHIEPVTYEAYDIIMSYSISDKKLNNENLCIKACDSTIVDKLCLAANNHLSICCLYDYETKDNINNNATPYFFPMYI